MREQPLQSSAYRFSVKRNGKEAGRAHLFLITNDLHDEPYGLLEDVFVEESYRGEGIGTELLEAVVKKAKEVGCYKLLATSRNGRSEVHAYYERRGFTKYGAAFRIDF